VPEGLKSAAPLSFSLSQIRSFVLQAYRSRGPEPKFCTRL